MNLAKALLAYAELGVVILVLVIACASGARYPSEIRGRVSEVRQWFDSRTGTSYTELTVEWQESDQYNQATASFERTAFEAVRFGHVGAQVCIQHTYERHVRLVQCQQP